MPANAFIRSSQINFHSQVVNLNMPMIAQESACITCHLFTGNGSIEAPVIKIIAKEFKFTGSIKCSKECTIITEKPFNHKMFKKQGKGTFNFEVNPDLFKASSSNT